MNVTPTAGIAAAWSAAKASPNQTAAQPANTSQAKPGPAPEDAAEPRKSPPAPEGQGARVDVRV
jgi:hypothetical protein